MFTVCTVCSTRLTVATSPYLLERAQATVRRRMLPLVVQCCWVGREMVAAMQGWGVVASFLCVFSCKC